MNPLKKLSRTLAIVLLSTLCALGVSDVAAWYGLPNADGSRGAKILRLSLTELYSAVTNAISLGDPLHYFANGYITNATVYNPTFGRQAVTANTTLTTSSPTFIGITNITAVTAVGNASLFPVGKPFVLKNETGSGVCTVTCVSNLDGSAWASNVTNTTALRIYNDGTGWQSY